MNKVILMGRLTRDPDVKYSQGEKPMAISRYTLAVDRKFKKDGEQSADFISCICFGKSAEFAEKYFRQGQKIAVSGRIQTGSYVNKDGQKVYTTDVVVDDQEFAESRKSSETNGSEKSNESNKSSNSCPAETTPGPDGFMNIPDGIDEELPFD